MLHLSSSRHRLRCKQFPMPHLILDLTPDRYDGCIPSALVTVGSNVSSLGRLLARLNVQLISTNEGGVVMLESGDAPNLKATLKNTIRAAITNTEGNDGYQSFLNDRDVSLTPATDRNATKH